MAALAFQPVTVLDVTHDPTGRLLWRVLVGDGATVDLDYTHSIFNAPTTDRFIVDGTTLRLVEIRTTSEAVLEHAGLSGPFSADEGRFVASRPGPALAELPIRIGQTGQQRLVASGLEIPMYRMGVGEALRIRVARLPRASALLSRTRHP